MAHLVCRKNRYWSLEESYREGKRVRKRTLFYFGTRRPSDPQARYDQMLDTAERKAEEWDDYQRREFGETAGERKAREKEEAKFSQEKFLESTTSPAPAEATPNPASPESDSPSEAEQSPSEPDAPGSDDASGSSSSE